MTVRELIAKLEALPPDMDVCMIDSTYGTYEDIEDIKIENPAAEKPWMKDYHNHDVVVLK